MTIAFVQSGADNSTICGTIAVAYPATTTSGNLLVMMVTNKHGANTVTSGPSGWTAPSDNSTSGGAGSDGVDDEGTCRATVFYKVATGSEGGSSVNITVSGTNTLNARIYEYSNATGAWSVACAYGSVNSASTSWSATMNADPGITGGDWLFAVTGVNGNNPDATNVFFSAQSFAATGLTMGANTERQEIINTQGNDMKAMVTDHVVTSGTASVAGTYTATASYAGASCPAGATVVLRMREISAATSTPYVAVQTQRNIRGVFR